MSLLWVRAAAEPTRYYHGTSLGYDEDLDEISPTHAAGGGSLWGPGASSSGEHAYATTDPSVAWDYAEKRHWGEGSHWSRPVVYEVEPTGPVEEDPHYDAHGYNRGNSLSDVRSRHPWTVVGEVPHPQGRTDWHCERCGSIEHSTDEHGED